MKDAYLRLYVVTRFVTRTTSREGNLQAESESLLKPVNPRVYGGRKPSATRFYKSTQAWMARKNVFAVAGVGLIRCKLRKLLRRRWRNSSTHPIVHHMLAFAVITSLLLGMMPHAAFAQEPAQEGGSGLFLPTVRGGLGQPSDGPPDGPPDEQELVGEFGEESGETPFTSFDEIPAAEMEAALMAQAVAELPEPVTAAGLGAASKDVDADGVANEADNCPFQPNPPRNGAQSKICHEALSRKLNHLVFLRSRIFLPPVGFDPALKRTQPRERVHVLLHVRPNENGVVLSPHQRTVLQAQGVSFLGYLPHNSYFVSMPRNLATAQQIIALENVRGISALRPRDKVAPDVRLHGAENGRNDDGSMSFDVDFFADVPPAQVEALLAQVGIPFQFLDEQTYRVTLTKWDQLRFLAIQDWVRWIEDTPDPAVTDTLDGQALINGQHVSNTLGLRGNGITVSMTELNLAEPITRTDMAGRVTLGNDPILEGDQDEDNDHPQMVSSILIADGVAQPERVGMLPEGELVSYSIQGLTIRAQHFGVNEEAHDDFGAVVSNNSWSVVKCNKIGRYNKRSKYFDRAVYDVGIAVVKSSGNSRGANGDFAIEGCQVELYSLPMPVAKNDISVGNWSVQTEALLDSSAAGPTEDERLKPDVVAPGQGIDTVMWSEGLGMPLSDEGGGTSASAPVVSGVVGWLAESFLDQGVILDDVMPARYKAILTHTAKDVGPAGPDFLHGYGLIQADRALRIAQEWSLWGREGVVDSTTTQVVFSFDVTTAMSFYKATLVWDDEEGEESSTMALKNDLDLTLISPSGVVYRPYEVVLPAGAVSDDGSVPCLLLACQDRLNTVEQVMALPSAGDWIEQGTWEAVVDTFRLVSDEQKFSLVLTPPCPVEINRDVTMTSDITCEGQLLEPTGVLIATDGVNLNCDNHQLNGVEARLFGRDGVYAGVRVVADDVTVRNCDIRRFDVGIKVDNGDAGIGNTVLSNTELTNATLRNNTFSNNGTIAIELVGDEHTARGNSVSLMLWSDGKGITVRGDEANVTENSFHMARPDGAQENNTVGILVHPGSENGDVTANTFDGGWWKGIRLRGANPAAPIRIFLIDGNQFEGIDDIPIELFGNAQDTTVNNNTIQAYGDGRPAIHVVAEEDMLPLNNVISSNTIIGFDNRRLHGIKLVGAGNTNVTGNQLYLVGQGIVEEQGGDATIVGNAINPTPPLVPFLTTVAIATTNSSTSTLIADNSIDFSGLGIVVNDPYDPVTVRDNDMKVALIGISVGQADDAVVTGNGISAFGGGILVANSPRAAISDNGIAMHGFGTGIGVGFSDDTVVSSNDIISPAVGIRITGTEAIIVQGNIINDPANTGIMLSEDRRGLVESNQIVDSLLGIHYRSGTLANISANTVTSLAGGVGVRLGTGAAGCPINVEIVTVQNNVLTGGAIGVEVLCDVGAHTLINN